MRKMKIMRLFPMLLSLLVGCATVQQVPVSKEFDPSETAWSEVEGNEQLTGSALLRTRGGDVRTCAGNDVHLIPRSAYSEVRMGIIYGNIHRGYVGALETKRVPATTDSKFMKTVRTSKCDAQGNFEFNKIPSGNYYVMTTIVWLAGSASQGGMLMSEVGVKALEKNKLILTY